ncbi:MAG: glycosyltransferase family 4 protein [Planctomycetota bacterium]
MKVVVDATMLDGGPSGAATRLLGLGRALGARGVTQVLHLVRPDSAPLPDLECRPFARADTPLRRGLCGPRLDALLVREGADLLAAGAFPLPRVRAVPVVLTVHDLRFLHEDARISLARRLWARHRLPANLERAARVVAVSRSTADELVERGLVGRERVDVVPNAASPGLARVVDADRLGMVRRGLGLNARYALALGPLTPHKRPGFLLDVLARVHALPEGADLSLVCAGRADAEAAAAFERRARAAGVEGHVRVVGPIDDEVLAALLCASDALLVPGTSEGFSIPVVDAQRARVPVVAVRAGALPEVAGEHAWFAPPDDADAFAAALLDAIRHGAARSARIERAADAAERWSWERSAVQLEQVWRRAAGAELSR